MIAVSKILYTFHLIHPSSKHANMPLPILQLWEADPKELVRPRNIDAQLMRNPEHPLGFAHELPCHEDDISLGLVAVHGLRHSDGRACLLRDLCIASLLGYGATLFDDVSCLLGFGDETEIESV